MKFDKVQVVENGTLDKPSRLKWATSKRQVRDCRLN